MCYFKMRSDMEAEAYEDDHLKLLHREGLENGEDLNEPEDRRSLTLQDMEGETYEDDHLKLLQREGLENGEDFNAERLKNDEDLNADLHNEDSDDDELNADLQNEDSNDDDPQYNFFLSHVRVNGKSFTFEIEEENGVNKIIEYQIEEPIHGWHDLKRKGNKDIILEQLHQDMILDGEQLEGCEPYTDEYSRLLHREELEWDEPAEILKNDEDLNENFQNEDSDDDELNADLHNEDSDDDELTADLQNEDSDDDELTADLQNEDSDDDELIADLHNEDSDDEDLNADLQNEDSDDEDLNAYLQNEDSDDDDPQYKFFLSHVRGNGKSFTFEIKEENGLNKIIEYQIEELIYGLHDLKTNGNEDIILEQLSKDTILDGEQLEDCEPDTDLNDDQFVKSDENLEEWDEPAEVLMNDDEDSDDDFQYKFFLTHVKGNGKSFTFEMKEENGVNKIIEYQIEEPIYGRHDLKRNGNKDIILEQLRKDREQFYSRVLQKRAVSRFHPKSDKDGLDKIGDKQWEKSLNVGRDVMNREQNFEEDYDEDYQRFLDSFEKETGMKNLRHENDRKIGHNGGLRRDNRIKVKNLRPRKSGNSNEKVEEDIILHMDESPETSELKSKVMAILRKPFDDQEYKKLWRDVTKRNRISRHKELQDGNEKSVTTRHKGKSYLKRYKAVRRELEAVRDDKLKRLNILRGFVFYLVHLGWGGEFKPWEDAACRAVMPGGS